MVPRSRRGYSGAGDGQAARLPEVRLSDKQVTVRRRGAAAILETLPDSDDWTGFWDRIRLLARPISRSKTQAAERRVQLRRLVTQR